MALPDAAQNVTPCPDRIPLGPLAKGDTHIRRSVATFRRRVEAALLERTPRISIASQSRLHTACVALRRQMQAEKRLRDGGDKLTAEQWAALADRTVRYKETVDRALQALGLDATSKPVSVWDQIYNAPALAPPSAHEPAGASVGTQDGIDGSRGIGASGNGNQEGDT
jgi:hypothetical protein